MPAAGALILFLVGAGADLNAGAPAKALSAQGLDQLGRLEQSISRCLVGRRLLAHGERLERRLSPGQAGFSGARYLPAAKVLAINSRRLESLGMWEAELALVRELARAEIDLPIELVEIDMAAERILLEFSLELAAVDKVFDERLRKAFLEMEKNPPRARDVLPAKGIERCAYLLGIFRSEPERFFEVVERGLQRSTGAVRMTELEDFLEKHHGADVREGGFREGSFYVQIHGRRYPASLVSAARSMIPLGGLRRLRESLAVLEPTSTVALRAKIVSWLYRNSPP